MAKFPVEYSLLDQNALTRMVQQSYLLSPDTTCQTALPAFIRFYSRGSNDLYQVESAEGSFFLRVSVFPATDELIQGEIDLLSDLADTLPVPRPIATASGDFFQRLDAPEGIRYAVLFEALPGQPGYPELNGLQARSLGMNCARLHQWADSQEHLYGRPLLVGEYLLEAPLQILKDSRALQATELEWVAALAKRIGGALAELPQTAPLFGLCHGDMIGGNALFAKNKTMLLDFDTSGYGWRAYDLATFVSSLGEGSKAAALREAFLKGYFSIRSIDKDELKMLPYFAVARQIWLIGRQAQIGQYWGHFWTADRMRDNMAQLRTLYEAL